MLNVVFNEKNKWPLKDVEEELRFSLAAVASKIS